MPTNLAQPGAATQNRPGRFASGLAVVAWALAVMAQAGRFAYLLPVRRYHNPAGMGASLQLNDLLEPAITLLLATFGALIVLRAAERRYGWLMLAAGFFHAMVGFSAEYSQYALLVAPQDDLPLGWLAAWVQDLWAVPMVLLIFLLPFLFPDGKLPSHRWQGVFWPVLAAWGLFILVLAFAERPLSNVFLELDAVPSNPLGFLPVSPSLYQAAFGVLGPVSVVIGLAGVITRWRSAGGEVRQQIKWIVYAFLLLLVLIAAFFVDGLLREVAGIDLGLENATGAALNLSLLGMLAALGLAVLKYRLYDIDLIIRRTLVYGALTAVLALVYFGLVLVLQNLIAPLTGENRNELATVLSTLAIVALFTPLRRRIQDFIDRRFYRRRYDAARILQSFATIVRDEVDLDRLSEHLVTVVQETMQPESISLWIREPGEHIQPGSKTSQ
jgi:hypothetical protein